jgi:hypothetical protein
MSETILATVSSIKIAIKNGAKREYNHAIKELRDRDRLIENHFTAMIISVKSEQSRLNIMRKKMENPHTIMLPITLALIHKHKMGVPCEDHARVYFPSNPGRIFDIPMSNWINMKSYYEAMAKRNNLKKQ